jgi:hydroxymethylbilane synthase
MNIRLGSRVSPLAMAQTQFVRDRLIKETGDSDEHFPIQGFTTTGDRIQDRRLQEAGGKGLFTKELDEALIDKRIDAAVHSMKDLPTKLPPEIVLACVPSREDPRDAFICLSEKSFMELPPGAIVGSASLRRQAQLLHLRPDLKVETLRGSVQTRLQKLADGKVRATFLALAGLKRLGLAGHATSVMDTDLMPPAAGQGALAVTCREDDTKTRDALAKLNLATFEIATVAERAFLDALDGSCRTPIGALAEVYREQLTFLGEVLTPDGRLRWRRTAIVELGQSPHITADKLGRDLATQIRQEAGARYKPNANGW